VLREWGFGRSLTIRVGASRIRNHDITHNVEFGLHIDAAESKQAFGKRSQQSLAQICGSKTAKVMWTDRDRYGRILGRVSCAEVDANSAQVRLAMAWVFDRYVTDRSLYALQDVAKAARQGLWRDDVPVPPWRWRAENRQRRDR
jgi:endonuclease YncB( thermonuclease family)